jgi:phage terminase small subunit
MDALLSPKHRRFVAEFLKDHNATQAAIRAGYSKKTANEQGSQLLAKEAVKNAVNAALKRVEDKSELTAERIHRAVLAVLEFDPRDAFDTDGTLKDISKMPASVAMAIAGIDVDDSVGDVKKLRFVDRMKAADLGAKLLGLLRLEITGKGGQPLVPIPPIDFSGITREDLRRLAGMRPGNGNGHSE